jgi:protein-L-isoaspartate(D-aspartate) O-methyltransferase
MFMKFQFASNFTAFLIPFALLFQTLHIAVINPSSIQDPWLKKRKDMVKVQIVGRGITDKGTLDALNTVPRHHFVPASEQERAYSDHPLPIGYSQTISQPYIVALMTEVIKPDKNMKVLEIGTGSGYQAAILSHIVKEVYTLEIVPELGKAAASRLKNLGYGNVSARVSDGYFGWPEKGPFDAIVVTAAAEFVPPPLLEQLAEGGRMIIPVGSPFMVQQLMLIEKHNGKTTTKSLLPVRFVPFTRGN